MKQDILKDWHKDILKYRTEILKKDYEDNKRLEGVARDYLIKIEDEYKKMKAELNAKQDELYEARKHYEIRVRLSKESLTRINTETKGIKQKVYGDYSDERDR
jgi:hypothetical protein